MDGAAQMTQAPIKRGETYRYEFTAVQSAAISTIRMTTPIANRPWACMAPC
jgi:FtsP/CotA-like multicopper oxidase with cupredoxin domain